MTNPEADHLRLELAMRLYAANIKSYGSREGMKQTAKLCWYAAEAFLEGIDEAMEEQNKE
jgi:hypothetical protein